MNPDPTHLRTLLLPASAFEQLPSGLTLLQHFAGLALQGLLANGADPQVPETGARATQAAVHILKALANRLAQDDTNHLQLLEADRAMHRKFLDAHPHNITLIETPDGWTVTGCATPSSEPVRLTTPNTLRGNILAWLQGHGLKAQNMDEDPKDSTV